MLPRKKRVTHNGVRDKLERKVNDRFVDAFNAAVALRYPDLKIETSWNIFTMQLVTTREDGADFTPEQAAFMAGYSDGYANAKAIVGE